MANGNIIGKEVKLGKKVGIITANMGAGVIVRWKNGKKSYHLKSSLTLKED